MNEILVLKPIEDKDIDRMKVWLNKEHVLKWYHDADEWLSEIEERKGSFSFLNHFIVFKEAIPIGFGQYYDCFDAQEEWYSIECPNEIFSIDYFIGEEKYLRKGYGKEIVKLLTGEIYKRCSKAMIIVQPEEENTASCKSLLANGFAYDEKKGYYIAPHHI
ncbi:MAG: GNAT family N-acetyltransferase [Dysgonomonas sp.]